MSRLRPIIGLTAAALLLAAHTAQGTETKAALSVTSLATPTNFAPGGDKLPYTYDVRVANLGGAATEKGAPITIIDTLPKGLTVKGGLEGVTMSLRSENSEVKSDYGEEACEIETEEEVSTVTCEISAVLPESIEPEVIAPLEERRLIIEVNPPAPKAEGEELLNHVLVEGGGSPPASTSSHGKVSKDPAAAAVSLHTAILGADGQPASEAATHPFEMAIGFAANTKVAVSGSKFVPAGGDLKDIQVSVPVGFASGAALSHNRCSQAEFNDTRSLPEGISNYFANACPDASAVGVVLVQQISGVAGVTPIPLYNLTPPPGTVAEFGSQFNNLPFYIDVEAPPRGNYRATATLRNLSELERLTAATTVIWGVPANPLHDPTRGSCLNFLEEFYGVTLPTCEPLEGVEEQSLLRLPTSCISALDIDFAFDTWSDPGQFISQSSEAGVPSGCNAVEFEPSLETVPTTNVADSPTGLHAHLTIPQKEEPEELKEPGEADLRRTVVTFPKGLAVNPATANGLSACSEAQIGYEEMGKGGEAIFSNDPASCPAASRVASVKVKTPLLDHTLRSGEGADGSVYVAMPHENPFNSLLALYIAIHDPTSGVIVKLAGKVQPDPVTGQLSASFEETPQLPFEDFELDFFGGPDAPLRTPALCGEYASTGVLTPWSAPESGPPAETTSPFQVTQPAPGHSSCPTSEAGEPNGPSFFEAGTVTPLAGAYSPLVVHLRREDGSQELGGLNLSPPPGLIAKLAGVPDCPEATLAAAAKKTGKEEQASPSCPAASELGSVQVGAGAGPAPYYTTGSAYLAPPYKGAPLSVAIITPAVAGPYDLGTVVVRTALFVDPETGRVTAKSDPLPHILEGVPLDLRSVAVKLDRSLFTLNPTNCNPFSFEGEAISVLGQAAPLTDHFQVGECKRLKFAPKLSLRLSGGSRRGEFPALRSTVTYPKGAYANLASAQVALPHSEFLAQEHIRTICTRIQFAAHACPPGSIYGHARATSPLVDYAVEGPIYLRSSSNPLPDLILALHGPASQPVEVDAVARIDSHKGGIRATFGSIPDLPISKVTLNMRGGKKGIFVNSTNICKGTHRATAKLTAQNARYIELRPPLKARCGGKGSKGHR